MREYTDCYVAFMDLLGFKAILGDKNMSCEKIAQIFDEIKKQYYVRDNEAPMVNPDDIHFRVMSDSVCIYINSAIEDSLLVLIFLCTFFQVRLLRLSSPILVRGGISKGNMYSNGDILFGPGLSQAYVLENDLAKYPRIIIPLDIVDDYRETLDNTKRGLLTGFLFMDFDCFYTINCFEMFTAWGYKLEDGERVKDVIYSILSTNPKPDIREKYLYLQSHIMTQIESAKERYARTDNSNNF